MYAHLEKESQFCTIQNLSKAQGFFWIKKTIGPQIFCDQLSCTLGKTGASPSKILVSFSPNCLGNWR